MMRRTWALLLSGVVACATPAPPRDDAAIDAHVAALDRLELPPERSEVEVACDAMCEAVTLPSDQACELRRYSGLSHEEQLVSLVRQPALWPGALVRGGAAAEGQLSPLSLARGPMTFSVSLENLDGNPAATMQETSLSAFRTSRQSVLAQGLDGATAAYVSFTIERVHSSSQLKATLKAQASADDDGLDGAYDFDGDASKTRVLVDFTQAYYSVDIDLPTRPSDYFAPEVTLAQVRTAMGSSPPMVVQSVTYGRRVLFAVESERSFTDVQASLEAAMTGWLNGRAELDTADQELLSSASISGLIIGGNAEDGAGAVSVDDLDDIVDLIARGGAYGPDQPGAPIAYRLAYLDGRPAPLAFATDYVTSDCAPSRGSVVGALHRISRIDATTDEDVYGLVALRMPTEGSPVTGCGQGGTLIPVLELDAQLDQFVTIPAGLGWTPASPPSVTVDDVGFTGDPLLCLEVELHQRGGGTLGSATQPLRFGDWFGTHVLNVFGPGGRHTEVELQLDR